MQISGGMYGIPSSNPGSMLQLDTGNGGGSTLTKVRRYLNVRINQGDAFTYVDDPVNGMKILINKPGMWVAYAHDVNSGTQVVGFTVNCTALTTDMNTITFAQGARGFDLAPANGQYTQITMPLMLRKGDVLRMQNHGSNNADPDISTQFTLCYFGPSI